jgi:hypothetical protein
MLPAHGGHVLDMCRPLRHSPEQVASDGVGMVGHNFGPSID